MKVCERLNDEKRIINAAINQYERNNISAKDHRHQQLLSKLDKIQLHVCLSGITTAICTATLIILIIARCS